MPNILSNLNRLKYHLGNLIDVKNDCPIYRQGKKEVYASISDYCLPTEIINLPLTGWTGDLNETEKQKTATVSCRKINSFDLVVLSFIYDIFVCYHQVR